MRKFYLFFIVVLFLFFTNVPVFAKTIPDALAPDMIIINGKIMTVDKNFSYAEAVAVKDGKIVAVGTTKEIEALKGKPTKVLDLKGNMLLPGINDSHLHLPDLVTGNPPYQLDLSYPGVKSIQDMRAMIKEAIATLPEGSWIIGRGWNQGYIDELLADPNRQLNKADFDDISPNNPVYLVEYSYHNFVVNSKTLEFAGITKDTPNPEGGIIVKDPKTGEPTGFIQEKAFGLIEAVKPPMTREEMKSALVNNVKYLTELGVTSITTASETPNIVNLLSEIAAREEYPVRVSVLLLWGEYGGLGGTLKDFQDAMKYVGTTTNFGSDRLRVGGVKIFADGIPPSMTAWSYEPYADGSYGGLVTSGDTDEARQQNLFNMIKFCHDQGYQIGVHASGDRAMAVTVEAFVEAQKANPWDARHYTVHGDWVPVETMKLMAVNNIGHTTQTAIKYDIADDMTRQVGEKRSGEQWPLKQMVDLGVKVANSSDAPVVPPDWRVGLQSSMLREGRATGDVSGPHQCLSLEEGIRSYTIVPAWLDHAEDVKGSVEAGKYADFCIIGADLTTVDPHKIMEVPIFMTIMDGKVVYSDGTLSVK